jgi:four helix bundle protein
MNSETRNAKIENRARKAPPGAVKDFTDLVAWRLGRELRRSVYSLTRCFPAEEKYVLVAQMRRAAISVTANLAEGFGRFSYQENIQFCRQSRGSAFELRDHLVAALDEGHISRERWKQADTMAQRFIQVLNGYIRSTRARQQAGSGE